MTHQTPITQSQKPLIKPYIPHTILIPENSQENFSQKHYKYIHHLESQCDNAPFLRNIPRLKCLQSLDLPTFSLGRSPRLVQKLIKPLRKYLKYIPKGLKNPKTEKLLPKLAQLSVLPDGRNTWKLLLSRSAFQRLSFNLRKPSFLLKYKGALSRNLPKMRQLRGLSITVSSSDTDLAILMLEILNAKAPFYSIKDFHLTLSLNYLPNKLKRPPKINKAIEHLTNLYVSTAEWYSLLLTAGEFKNLATLNLALSPNLKSWDFRHLSHFKDLLKLKKLTFGFTASSIDCEREFFENFTVAPALEYLDFTMIGFCWNKEPLTKNNRKAILDSFVTEAPYIHFFDRLKDWKNLKVLALTIKKGSGTRSCPSLAGKFASLFIRRLTTLERVNYSNPKEEEKQQFQDKPLKLEDFWKGLEQSKETLHTVSVNSPEMAFPASIEVLETRFPRLQSLILEKKVLYVTKLSPLWRKIPSLKKVYVQDLEMNDERRLKELLDDVQEIPEEMDVTLFLNVKQIKQKLLMDCLKKYIGEVKVKGNFGLYFKYVEAEDIRSYFETLMLVVDKGCFKTFKMDMNTRDLFYVRKDEILIMANELKDEYEKINLC